jgi:hypothetical protein
MGRGRLHGLHGTRLLLCAAIMAETTIMQTSRVSAQYLGVLLRKAAELGIHAKVHTQVAFTSRHPKDGIVALTCTFWLLI